MKNSATVVAKFLISFQHDAPASGFVQPANVPDASCVCLYEFVMFPVRQIPLIAILLCGFVAIILSTERVTAQTPPATKAARVLANLQEQHRAAYVRMAEALERIAQICEERNLNVIAMQVRRIAQPVDPDMLRFEPLPRSIQPPISPDLSDEEREWRTQLRDYRREYAKQLDLLAQQAVKSKFPSYAFQLVREAVLHDSDHERARRLLGYVRYKDEWVSPFERQRLDKKEVWTTQFGWLPAAHVERYQSGERFYLGKWMSAQAEANQRQDFSKAWEIRTEHYRLKTNHSLERGVELATALEEFHRFFQQTFAAFFDTPQQLQKLFASTTVAQRPLKEPFQIHFFSSRDEYISKLKARYQGQILALSNGVYDTDDRIVYCFENPGTPAETTMYHEATHQLLAAHLKPSPMIANRANFWLIEGFACYIESFQRQQGRLTLGDPQCIRFATARERLLKDGYYMPLEDFTRLGKDAYQAHPRLQNNYSQAAGIVHFLMHYDKGRYRDDLIEHLRLIYQQAEQGNSVPTLADLTGTDFKILDQQYTEFSKALSQALQEQFAQQL